jgi:hypothetical protein
VRARSRLATLVAAGLVLAERVVARPPVMFAAPRVRWTLASHCAGGGAHLAGATPVRVLLALPSGAL